MCGLHHKKPGVFLEVRFCKKGRLRNASSFLYDKPNEWLWGRQCCAVKALFDAGCKWRLVEEFGAACFQEQPDGRLLFWADYTDEENLLTWLLSFRDRVELLEPEGLRKKMRRELERTQERYT